jgi:hypothetical protein
MAEKTTGVQGKILRSSGQVEDLMDKSLESLQKVVGGYIEHVNLRGVDMWVNEDGKNHSLPLNGQATKLFQKIYGCGDFIVGDVALTGKWRKLFPEAQPHEGSIGEVD